MSTSTRTDIDLHAAALRADPLFLDRCQVDTPSEIVALVWDQIKARRRRIQLVVDFGAGDGEFARGGTFARYLGYEVDSKRCPQETPAGNIRIVTQCAFTHRSRDADICIGNPPYVRSQDLPTGWRAMAAAEIRARTGVTLSGLANAWQYFFMLALWSAQEDGLVAQILPYEWVSRPAAAPVRDYIDTMGWSVNVYRLSDPVFTDVLTAASITIVDKRGPAEWRFHQMDSDGAVRALRSASGASAGVLPYTPARSLRGPRAKRGLSPGTQHVLTLTEGERVHVGLHVTRDVVRCVTSLRGVPAELKRLARAEFDEHLVSAGAKCWLIRTDRDPSPRLKAYLNGVNEGSYQTATCLGREEWWRFSMPRQVPAILIAQAFKGDAPKAVLNEVGAHAVGGVAGIYNVDAEASLRFLDKLATVDLSGRLVPYAKEMRKLEINQINSLLASIDDGVR